MSTDLAKANREMVDLTAELISTENERLRKTKSASREELAALDAHAAGLKQRIDEVTRLRRFLAGETTILGEPVKPRSKRAKDVAPGLPDARSIGEAQKVMQKYAAELAKLRQDLIPEELRSSEFIKVRFAIENDAQLKQLGPEFKQRLLDAAALLDQVKDIARAEKERAAGLADVAKDVTKQGNDEIAARAAVRRAIIELIDPIQRYRDEIAKVEEALQFGDITPDQAASALLHWNEQIEAAQDLSKQTEQTADEMTEFMREAARSMQGAMSDFFFGVMQGDLSDFGGNFKRTLDRMVADVLAAQAATALFGKDFGKDSSKPLGGFVGDLLKPDGFLGDFASGIKGLFGFASGGSFTVGGGGQTDSQLVMFRATPGERVTVQTPAQAAGGRRPLVVHINQAFAPGADRRSFSQAASEAARVANREWARNG